MLLAAAVCLALAAPAAEITPESVAAALDPVFARCSPEGTPGATVSVVHAGRIIFLKGYGTADPATGEAVDPARHLFRLASVSKLFTATAVMQLVEQGRVDLDADVNTYLDPPVVPEAFGRPITLRNLLQHAAGLDDEFLGMARETAEGLPSLKDYLATGLPRRVFEPGHFASYSNHGSALAGLVVEEVSGKPFAQYVREHIFAPLGMENSHFDLVPTPETPLAAGHWRGLLGGPLKRAGYDYPLTVPASTLASTAEDMAKFMLAHLAHGGGILRPETAATMHAEHKFGVPGLALGFFDRTMNGRRTLSHTGHIWGYASILQLVPEEDFGVFISLTTEESGLYDKAVAALMDTFYPTRPAGRMSLLGPPHGASAFSAMAGHYRHTRYPRHSFLKFGLLVSGRVREITIAPSGDGGVRAGGTLLYPNGDLFYRGLRPYESQFDLDPSDAARFLAADYSLVGPESPVPAQFYVRGSAAYERIAWWEDTWFLLRTALACLAVLVLWLIAGPALRWRRLRRCDAGKVLPRGLFHAANTVALALLIFVAGVAAILGTINPLAVAYGPPGALPVLLCLPLLALGLVPCLAAGQAWAIARRQGTLVQHVHLAVTTGAAGVLLAILHYWNLLGFHLP